MSLAQGAGFSFGSGTVTAQKMKFFFKHFLNKCDQTRRKLWILSHLLKKSLTEKFFFCAGSKQSFLRVLSKHV